YDVLMKKDVKRTLGEVKKPKVKANDGFTFKAWDKADTTELVVNEKTEVTATYNQNVIISDDPNTPVPDGYVRATFKTDGAKGAIEATINGVKKTTLETVVMDVLPKTKTVGELKANLTLTAKDDNVFEGWSKPDDYLVANNVTIEALYQGGQTNTPTATALNVGKDNFTTIKGKAEPGATVIARVNGEKVGEATANNDGDYIIKATKDGKKLPDRTEAKVTATKAPMTESAWQPVIVLPDANSDGIPDGDLQAPAKPKLDPPRTKDTQVTMKVPTEPDAKKIIVKVTEADGNPVTTVEAIKDGDTWKVDGKPLTVDDTDRISIPLPNTELKEGQKVIANVFDESDNKSEPAIKIVSNKDPLAKPEINTPKQRDKTVSGKAPGAEKVDVIVTNKDGTVADKKTDQSVNADGSFTVPVNDLKDGQKVTVKASAKDKDPSEASKKVGLELDKVKETKKEADGVVDQAIKDNNWKPDDPGANPFDKNLKDKMDKAADVIKDAEDNNDANDPTQDAVDQAEKELRDAIKKKDADTKVSAVEDKVKNGEKPAAEDIQAAQDAIDKIEGSTDPTADDFDKDKKDLQDRLDKAKALDDLKDAKDDLDKVIDKAVEEKKPAEEIDKAKEDSKTGGDIINNGGDGKTAEEIVKVVEKIKETTKILGQPAIQIRIDSANYNSRNLALTTNPGRCKLSITIYYAAGGEETIETTTGPGGVATILLKTPLQLDDDIVVKASQDASTKDYLDNSISATVY
ncbi:MAG: Ig-like domain-containing protein, partial [Peptococcus niger]